MSRKILPLFFALLTAAPGLLTAQHNPLLPRPQESRYGTGELAVRGMRVCLASTPAPEDRFAANELAAALSADTGTSIPVAEENPCHHGILLRRTGGVDPLPSPGEHPGPDSREAYSLEVTSRGATVTARSSAGLYYAVQTLKQLVEGRGAQIALPVVDIHDWPALAYRGTMVDMSHGALPTEKEVERQLDFLARWKANQYYFYSEDSIQLHGFPLINPDARFTQAEVRRIIAYGLERHIDVVPCLELYAHQHDLFRIEKYSTLSDLPHGTEFDPTNPQVKALLKNWVQQFAYLFPSPFVHIGYDETFQIELAAQKGGMNSKPAQLFLGQLNLVDGLFRHYGKTVMAWGDIMVKYPGIVSQLPPGLIAVAWDYDPDPKGHYQHWLGPLVAQHVPHMFAPGIMGYEEIMPDFDWSFENIDEFTAAGRQSGAMGMINTLWTDDAQNLMRAQWPGLAYGAVAAWQSAPVDRPNFFSQYSQLMYPLAISSDVGQALKDLQGSERALARVFGGRGNTMPTLWKDPFAPKILKKCTSDPQDLRQTRLLAEDAETHLDQALSEGGDPVTLKCLLLGSRMLDYAGERFQTAPEMEAAWQQLGPRRPSGELWWDLWEDRVTSPDHALLADLMDAITGLRSQYRHDWLAEYTPYRLGAALSRWDAECQYWRALQERLRQFSDNSHAGQPLPPLETLVEAH